MHSIVELLIKEGFVSYPEGTNLVEARRAFTGARAINWIRSAAADDKNFELQPYLVALTYYKLGLADLKFEDNELLYRYTGSPAGGLIDEFTQGNPEPLGGFHSPKDPAPHFSTDSSECADDDEPS